MILFFTIFVILHIHFAHGANILAITTLLSPSHHLFHDVYLLELAERGHNITLLGHDEDKHGHPNYTHIVMEGVYNQMRKSFDLMKMKDMSDWETIKSLWSYTELTCMMDFETQGLQKIIEYPSGFKFDLIIWDINNGQCLFPLIDKFGRPPVIYINPFLNQPNTFKNVWQSYIPFMTHTHTDHMTFWQKIKTTFFNILLEITREIYLIPRQQELAESHFGKLNFTIKEIERNVSLMLTNHNPVFNYVEALPPNIIPIGGLHVQPKPLPEDLKAILDESKHGVILFSLGSNVRCQDLGDDKIQAILKTFSKLKQDIIWKFGHDKISHISKNVHIRKWVPQNDILAHKNTVLFITHGGLLSSHEIVYNGVPVIGIPFFLDQLQNIGNFVAKGIGLKLEFEDITEDNFYNVIQEVLNNKSYSEKVKNLSVLYKHRINTPLETVVYWMEYILKFKTAKHFNLSTRDMNLIDVGNLDIILFFSLPFLTELSQ
ncbi:UDP-glycosyltransferase UGT5-like [Zophobas morio]|uniref:UDP-glycosyltransferase UGT5-like n=1 Tax=Zophobas morio TaxID=2755281 RepID=UPI0030834BA3